MSEKKAKRRPAKAAKSRKQPGQDHVDDEPIVAGLAAEPKAEPAPKTLYEQLLPQHRKLIDASAIAPEIANERGYESITTKVRLKELGFAARQCNVPALHIPLRGVQGEIVGRQIRPDTPRIVSGKALKYETPKGSGAVADICTFARTKIGDPHVPLFITEGVRKADSAASIGIVCIALAGVWSWRGKNAEGGLTALAVWESIALNDRDVYVCFDSDVTTKEPVRLALVRLTTFLKSKKAKVKIVYLPDGPNGEKVGLDDYLATGKTLDDLLALAKSDLPPKSKDAEEGRLLTAEYRPTKEGTALVQYDEEGNEILHRLANFIARIKATVIEDDGVTQTQVFRLDVRKGDTKREVDVPASDFAVMFWTTKLLGPSWIVDAGLSNRDHMRAAIQSESEDHETQVVYLHTGWIRGAGGDWCYLHNRGAIGARGCVPGISVKLPDALAHFVLPDPPTGEELRKAIHAELDLLELGPAPVMFVLVGSKYRAVMGTCDYSVHIYGTTGVFKTEIVARIQAGFGAKFDSRNLPGNWSSTANALEATAFVLKDAVMAVDDFVPQGLVNDVARANRDADRVMRGQGNNSGRQRCNPDGSVRAGKFPRGLIDPPPVQWTRG